MGKRGRKTRWRTLTIADTEDLSEDSEASTVDCSATSLKREKAINYHHHHAPHPSSHHHHHRTITSLKYSSNGSSHQHHTTKSYLNRISYSASSQQSTPIRKRYQCDNITNNCNMKFNRTTATNESSNNKITFNEDEYTRITTPRQDVLFKKGYLNKPKLYQQNQQQTSSSSSTNGSSTSSGTGNGTPDDHQSTDLEYESQFVFPNGFVDQNGIYYINGFEYPIMLYNPPTYYPQQVNYKMNKRDSTGSLTGESSSSPNNEEAASDDQQYQSNELPSNQIYNFVYPPTDAVYFNGETDGTIEQQDEAKRVKLMKRRRRIAADKKLAKSNESTSECSEEEEEETETKEDQAAKLLNGISNNNNEEEKGETTEEEAKKVEKYDLKPDAEEFVPMAYRPTLNFVPIELTPAFIPAHPINFIAAPLPVPFAPEPVEEKKSQQIDIAKIVSKLEQAAKEQDEEAEKKEETPKKVLPQKNYSETLKKSTTPTTPSNQKINASKKKDSKSAAKLFNSNQKEEAKNKRRTTQQKSQEEAIDKPKLVPTQPNQWISVSTRKNKRKNQRATEDSEDFAEDAGKNHTEDELFESYDVNLLQDVVSSEPKVEKTEVKCKTIEIVEEEPIETKEPEEAVSTKVKKGGKKAAPAIKRVIIKDLDLSETLTPIAAKKAEEKPKKAPSPPPTTPPSKVEEKKEATVESKKPKKKKKKKVGSATTSECEANQSVGDESFDFLQLDRTLTETALEDKTNIEISAEFDKMIQRGIYLNLEDKIKSLKDEEAKIISEEDFFKTIINENISSRRRSHDSSQNLLGGDDNSPSATNLEQLLLNKPQSALNPSYSMLRPVMMEPVRANLNGFGDFLCETSNSFAKLSTERVGSDEAAASVTKSYPITNAVREWMTKTFPSFTPDVEILKSPQTIQKELMKLSLDEEDLLEYWEDEEVSVFDKPSGSEKEEEEEEEIEVYNSEYGKNQDYLNIQNEIAEKTGSNGAQIGKSSLPTHGNLPYRAICCSIM